MIIMQDAILGIVNIIVFQLTKRIVVAKKSLTKVIKGCNGMLGFSYLAIPTRHDKSIKPHLYDINRISLKP